MIVEWYALKCFSLGVFFGYVIKKGISDLNTFRCYEIKEFRKRK